MSCMPISVSSYNGNPLLRIKPLKKETVLYLIVSIVHLR